jgi:hypothetical protein
LTTRNPRRRCKGRAEPSGAWLQEGELRYCTAEARRGQVDMTAFGVTCCAAPRRGANTRALRSQAVKEQQAWCARVGGAAPCPSAPRACPLPGPGPVLAAFPTRHRLRSRAPVLFAPNPAEPAAGAPAVRTGGLDHQRGARRSPRLTTPVRLHSARPAAPLLLALERPFPPTSPSSPPGRTLPFCLDPPSPPPQDPPPPARPGSAAAQCTRGGRSRRPRWAAAARGGC